MYLLHVGIISNTNCSLSSANDAGELCKNFTGLKSSRLSFVCGERSLFFPSPSDRYAGYELAVCGANLKEASRYLGVVKKCIIADPLRAFHLDYDIIRKSRCIIVRWLQRFSSATLFADELDDNKPFFLFLNRQLLATTWQN